MADTEFVDKDTLLHSWDKIQDEDMHQEIDSPRKEMPVAHSIKDVKRVASEMDHTSFIEESLQNLAITLLTQTNYKENLKGTEYTSVVVKG